MISSTANKQVRRVVNLVKKAKTRREEDLYVVEGIRMVSELVPEQTEQIYVSESFLKNKAREELLSGFSWEAVSDPVMKTMADTQTPQGILALVKQKHYSLDELLQPSSAGEKAHILILETLQDPGNLGTILRAGEGAGITGVVMDETTADIYNPKVIRSTMGSVYRVPFVYVKDLGGKNSYDREDFTVPCGFLLGNEAKGLSEPIASLAHTYIRIPMAGKVESLIAAVAASILMFETARQRREGVMART